MSGERRWWSGHELYGNRPEKYRFRENVYQEYPYIDLSPRNEDEIELSYWKSIYPEKVKGIQQRVEDICEQMEYINSPMYDEYPDRVYLRMLGNRIYDEMAEEETELESKEIKVKKRPERNPWMRDIIDVLLFQEMHRRRCKRGRCGRRWY